MLKYKIQYFPLKCGGVEVESSRKNKYARKVYKYAQIWRTVCLPGDEAEPETRWRDGEAQNELCENETVCVAVPALNFKIFLCI